MIRSARRALVLSCILVSAAAAQTTSSPAAQNLAKNPGLEELGGTLANFWEPLSIGAPAEFAIDAAQKHGGNQSVRLSAKEVTRSYVYGAPIQVAPGERVKVSAWVKAKDVPTDKGTA